MGAERSTDERETGMDQKVNMAPSAALRNVASMPGFIPSNMGLAQGLMAPHGDGACNYGYESKNSPFKHIACHDPRRFVLFSFDATTDINSRLTIAKGQSRRLLQAGIGEMDADAGWSDFGIRSAADTNLEKGGYLVPPGHEGVISAIGFTPVDIFLKPTADPGSMTNPGSFDQPLAGLLETDGLAWRAIAEALSVKIEYWEETSKVPRNLGSVARWPVGDGMHHRDRSSAGAPGAFSSRPNPLQYHVPTLGPAERRGDEVADRLAVLVNTERTIVIAAGAVTPLTANASFRVVIRLEISVGLVTDKNIARDNEQDSEISQLRQEIKELRELARR